MRFFNLLLCVGMAVASGSPQRHAYRDVSGNSISLAPKATSTASASQQPDFTFDELYDLQKEFLDNFISPNNTIQVGSLLPCDGRCKSCSG